ncbi:MAG: bis-aminopropyl spermidine synthase family protein [Synergistetes bacterium]|nr:MAG: Uncharacterized protein XD52_1333 [bacterium 42_11]MBC7331792.1 bis-aminopropyl spermidine synthase family protein [Synergistota bacterium]MDK2872219.1 N4-bis(aminopropyl)spermidine synthase [bacterium]
MEIYASQVRKETNIPIFARDVERVLSVLFVSDDFWQIVRYSMVSLPAVASLIKLLEKEGWIKYEGEKIVLTEKGKREAELAGVHPYRRYICDRCNGKTVVIDAFKEVYEEFLKLQGNRPEALHRYDQGYVTPETTLARVAFADMRGDVRGREIIALGDDDLVGLALALTGLPKRVVVIDIDKRILDFESKIKEEKGLDMLELRRVDLREPLPEDLLGKFDVFFTDPEETLPGFKAFVYRGIATLKGPGCAGYVGITHVETSLSKWREIQKFIVEAGLAITDIINEFNEYVNWPYYRDMRAYSLNPVKSDPKDIWYVSALYRIETLDNFQRWNEPLAEDIYEDDESSTT